MKELLTTSRCINNPDQRSLRWPESFRSHQNSGIRHLTDSIQAPASSRIPSGRSSRDSIRLSFVTERTGFEMRLSDRGTKGRGVKAAWLKREDRVYCRSHRELLPIGC